MTGLNTYRKLSDGTWAVVCWIGPNSVAGVEHKTGDVVAVTLRDGRTKEETLGAYRGTIDGGMIFATVPKAKTYTDDENAAPLPITNGRIEIVGDVLTVKEKVGHYGPVLKMLVKAEAGWKVWGTVPAALGNVERGAKVAFTAGVTPSDNDPKFGFFNRPAAARLIEPAREINMRAA